MLSNLLLLGALVAQEPVDWRTNLDASLQIAERDGRPLLLVFR